ncbi:TnsA endonuclease N-terminal domain-containing protein [Acinetobacter lwoffii]|uniref:TnsA endonuclease C-terminal domain-containing protein n=1 Tax=Acinetobacter lwoffii TaxID=28090 RepID=UPI00272FFEC6|nr:TnsA endonuclease C-terminal domain-containing protein [Acinetobacter lwoffii]MDP1315561.1 TnsA endonuclease N-terminal domain-containing protein [Acinetobacter lwoffii]
MAKIIKNYEELITQGYGQGHGRDYKPCKTVHNFSSIGRSHRVQGRVSKRLHHFFSDLELSTFLLLDWNQNVTDIREHYPLDIYDLNSICSRYQIKKVSIDYIPFTLSSDFLVNFGNFPIALETLYSKDLNKAHIIESLEIKRRYWEEEHNTPFKLITEKDIPITVLDNIKWMYVEKNDLEITNHLADQAIYFMKEISHYPQSSLISFCKHIDQTQKADIGATLALFRKLFALRLLQFNLETPYLELKLSNIHISNLLQNENTAHATN